MHVSFTFPRPFALQSVFHVYSTILTVLTCNSGVKIFRYVSIQFYVLYYVGLLYNYNVSFERNSLIKQWKVFQAIIPNFRDLVMFQY